MARVTVEDCLENVANRFDLVLIASKRARDITKNSYEPFVEWENDKSTVVALREIAEGYIDESILDDDYEYTPVHKKSAVQDNIDSENEKAFPEVLLRSDDSNNSSSVIPSVILKPMEEESSDSKDKPETDQGE